MPWTQMDALTQREDFIQDWLRRGFPMRGLCAVATGLPPKPATSGSTAFRRKG